MGRYESRQWLPSDTAGYPYRPRGRGRPWGTYGAFVPDLLSGWEPSLPLGLAGAVSEAETLIRRTDASGSVESPAAAEWLLVRAESVASSRIEGVFPSLRRIAGAEARQTGLNPTDRMAMGNISVTAHALAMGARERPITVDDLCGLHRCLMEYSPYPETGGRIRDRQNWIGPEFSTPLDAVYVPPPPAMVRPLLEDLVSYINTQHHQPLVQAALVHSQFIAIHPFEDGNGRTGRALIHLVMRKRALTRNLTVPVSSVLARHRSAYIDSLNAGVHVGPEHHPDRMAAQQPWLQLLADSATAACDYSTRIQTRLTDIRRGWEETVPLRGEYQRRMVRLLPTQPVFDIPTVAGQLGVSQRTAARVVSHLQAGGVLRQRNAGKRNRVFEASAIVDLFASQTDDIQPAPW